MESPKGALKAPPSIRKQIYGTICFGNQHDHCSHTGRPRLGFRVPYRRRTRPRPNPLAEVKRATYRPTPLIWRALEIDDSARRKIFATNAMRVYPRLKEKLATEPATKVYRSKIASSRLTVGRNSPAWTSPNRTVRRRSEERRVGKECRSRWVHIRIPRLCDCPRA